MIEPRTSVPADDARDAGHRALYLDATVNSLDVKNKALGCKVSMLLATFPDKSVFGFMDGRATVDLGDMVTATTDCVVKALEDRLVAEIVPVARKQLGL